MPQNQNCTKNMAEESKNVFNFGNFGVNTNFTFGSSVSEQPAQTTPAETAESEDPEKDEVKINFEPVVKLTEVKTVTGEEDEDCLFKMFYFLFYFIALLLLFPL